MPTSYTYPVCEGKITDFNEFALSCARAFGALIMMRDDPANAPIPDEFKPSDYHVTAMARAEERLAFLRSLSPDDAESEAERDYEMKLDSARAYNRSQIEADARLEAMAAKVEAWEPPTPDHAGLKSFMLEQIGISKNGDYRSPEPERLTGPAWLEREIKSAVDRISSARVSNEEEIERARGRTEWVKQLRKSLIPDGEGSHG